MSKIKSISLLLSLVLIMAMVSGCGATQSAESKDTETSTQPESSSTGKRSGNMGNLDTSSIEKQYTDISYSNVSNTQTLNIYLPNEGEGPFPVIIAIHGGAFKMGSATGGDVGAMLKGVDNGYAVISINYRLSDEAIFPAAINDCKAAIRFIRANASKYNLDADKIAVWGDSAGANLAALVGTTGDEVILEDDNKENLDYSSSVQAVVDWFGPLEFLKMDEQFETLGVTPSLGKTSSETSPESQYIGQIITADEKLTQKSNPATYLDSLDKAKAPSFFIQHGTKDTNVPYLQSENFATLLTETIGSEKVEFELLDGAGHGTQEFTTDDNVKKVFEFLDKTLK